MKIAIEKGDFDQKRFSEQSAIRKQNTHFIQSVASVIRRIHCCWLYDDCKHETWQS